MSVKITDNGWMGIIVGLIIAIVGCLGLPLPMFYGAIAFLGGIIAILFAIYFHEHK